MTETGDRAVLRLSPTTIAALPPEVTRPAFDRASLHPGILHLGVGAFHRCHQADFTDDAIAARFGHWGICGVNLAPPDLAPTLGAQSGLFCREVREGGRAGRRLIGSLLDAFYAGTSADKYRARQVACEPGIRIVSLTVTEKGYCHVPATGMLDLDHPAIRRDLADPERADSVPAFVARLLSDRWSCGLDPPVILSCDNIPDNGDTLRRCVIDLATERDAGLARRIAAEVAFPNSMVDRIVPATKAEDIAGFARETGLEDAALVVGEPFRMWVIEDCGAKLPAWQDAGAVLTSDVRSFEILKMRVVNGIQSNLCHLGLLAGIEFMADVVADETFGAFAERTIRREVLPCLPAVTGLDAETYLHSTLARLRNPDLHHATAQISTDGSQKIRQRLLEPLRAARRANMGYDGLALGVAGWMQYACGHDCSGASFPVNDPLSEATLAIGNRTRDRPEARVRALLGLREIFGTDLATDAEVVARLGDFVHQLQRHPARAVVRAHLG